MRRRRKQHSNPDLNLNRDRSYWDIVWSWSDELEGTELLQPGETINRKIHITYYVDGDYVLRLSGGRAFLKFPIVRPWCVLKWFINVQAA